MVARLIFAHSGHRTCSKRHIYKLGVPCLLKASHTQIGPYVTFKSLIQAVGKSHPSQHNSWRTTMRRTINRCSFVWQHRKNVYIHVAKVAGKRSSSLWLGRCIKWHKQRQTFFNLVIPKNDRFAWRKQRQAAFVVALPSNRGVHAFKATTITSRCPASTSALCCRGTPLWRRQPEKNCALSWHQQLQHPAALHSDSALCW